MISLFFFKIFMVYWAPCHIGDVAARIILIFIYCGVTAAMIMFIFMKYSIFNSTAKACYFVVLVFYILFSVLWIWAHISLSWMDAGSVEREIAEHKTNPLSEELQSHINNFPPCSRCNLPKSRRTHHCSSCNKCYFRFDHHCPAIGNCVALKNMKAFILFMVYSSCLLIVGGASALLYLGTENTEFKFIYWILFGGGILLAVYISGFGFSFCPNTIYDHTTLEGIAKVNKNKYSIDGMTSFRQIFGKYWWEWFLPMQNRIDGFEWARYYEEIDQTPDEKNNLVVVQFDQNPVPENGGTV